MPTRIQVIDSHTGGEPTRVVISGGPNLGNGSLAQRLIVFRERFDEFRSAVVNEPRGSDVLVGALLCEPVDPSCAAGIIFFNNVGYLGMCGHGLMGVVVTLAHLGRISPGTYAFETPVGVVNATLEGSNTVTIENVPSRRIAKDVALPVPDMEYVVGDIAWGGNWFFLVEDHPEVIHRVHVDILIDVTWRIRQALFLQDITGDEGQQIDHVELFGPPETPGAHSKNFVLCPGKAYDRSPCGTGTSAKLACLISDGKLKEGQVWRQESIIGSVFDAWATIRDGQIIPHIRGTAYVTADVTLLFQDNDPFRQGIRA